MDQLLIPILFGFLLLGGALYWLLCQRGDREPKVRLPEAISALDSLESHLLPASIVKRIFDPADQAYIGQQSAPDIQKLFLRERTHLAISWLRETQRQLSTLMNYHLRWARVDAQLSPAMELRLAAEYCLFLATCETLIVLVWLRGPFHVQRVAGYALHSANELCQVSIEIFAKMESSEIARSH